MRYRVELAEAAEAEIDAAYLRLARIAPEVAARWHSGLLRALESLSEMPRRCPLARESERFDVEVRQLLFGYTRNTYRVLFIVIEPRGPAEEATVRILHIWHAARQPGAEAP